MNVDFTNIGQRWRQVRFNPLRSLTPERLTSALDSWAAGWLREAALIFETIEQRDAICKSVISKRKAGVARRPWQILLNDEEDPAAEAHKEALEYFYNNLTVTDATDLNVRSGVGGLMRQMMDAVVMKYAVHEIVWKPGPGGLTAELRRVPLYFFENRTGRLRFIGPDTRVDGIPLEENGWMITCGEGLGEALAICWMFKRLGVQDLLAFSEKFSIPGILGRTTAKAGSPEARAMLEAVESFSSDWKGILTDDDGTHPDPIKVISVGGGGGSSLPQMTIAEYMDRAISSLCRGADLSTMSRENGDGASLQGKEAEALLEDDCAIISEVLQTQLDALVIRMVFGDVKPLAYISISPPSDADLMTDLKIDQGLTAIGVIQKPSDLAARYGRSIDEDAPAQPGSQVMPPNGTIPEGGSIEEEVAAMRTALNEDLQPLGEALANALAEADYPAMRGALKKISQRMPDFAAAPLLEKRISAQLTAAFIGGDPQSN